METEPGTAETKIQVPEEAKPISDDQELAKALAGITQATETIKEPETPIVPNTPTEATEKPLGASEPKPTPEITPDPTPEPAVTTPEATDSLVDIKKDAMTELRPLVDKLDLVPEEKFEIYLLLLRGTDDQTLLAPAHEAARNISDEKERAQALLDIIKEIDYFSAPQETE